MREQISKKWGRLMTAMITPFKQDGSLNTNEIERLASFLVEDQKNDGIVVAGSTGESPTTTLEEKLETLDIVLKTVGDKATVIFGSGTNNTQESIMLTQAGEKAGAHGIMLVNPAYNRPGQEGQFAHFSAIAKSTSLPLMIYNNPGRAAINLETSTLLRLIEACPNLVAVKEASCDMNQITEICCKVPENFLVYSGDDYFTIPLMSAGGYGVISVAGQVVGKYIKEMINAFENDPKKAAWYHQKLYPVFQSIFIASNPIPINYAMSLKGFDCEKVRLPLVQLNDEQKNIVRNALCEFESIAEKIN